MIYSDALLFPAHWISVARHQLQRLRAVDADHRVQHLAPGGVASVLAPAASLGEQFRLRRAGEARFTRSHERMSAFILRDLTSSADDTFAS